jgi:hypothetical protein
MFDEAADDPAHVLLGVSQGLDNVGDASVGFDHPRKSFVLSIPRAPAKPHCCGKTLNATSATEVGDGVVAQSGR